MIPFTQYLRPNGKIRKTEIIRSEEIEKIAHELIEKGCWFTVEELMTGTVSMTAEHPKWDECEMVVAHKICANNEQVPSAVDALIRAAQENFKKGPPDYPEAA